MLLAMSSTSLMSDSRCWPLSSMVFSAVRCCSVSGPEDAVGHGLRLAQHGVERRAQLVAHVGEELVLHPRHALQALVRPAQDLLSASRCHALGDVHVEAGDAHALALLVAPHHAEAGDPPPRVVLAPACGTRWKMRSPLAGSFTCRFISWHALAVLGVHAARQRLEGVGQLGVLVAELRLPDGREVHGLRGDVPVPQAELARAHRQLQPPVGLLEQLLDASSAR